MVVVGGGVVGSAVAWRLAREGLAVTLLERDDVGAHASGAAAGMLAPLVEAETPGPLLTWGLRGLAGFPALVAELEARSGIDVERVASGILRVARDETEAAALSARADADAEHDLAWLDAEAVRAAEPGIAPDVVGALWSPREGHLRSPLLTRAFARSAQKLGARFVTGAPVTELIRDDDRVSGVRTPGGDWAAAWSVLCTGCWTGALGPALPMEPVRGQILSLDAPRDSAGAIVWGGSTYLIPRRDGSLWVGASEEHVGFDCRVTAAGVAGLLEAATALMPGLAGATFREAWAGLRPMTPDRLPLIGPVPGAEGLLVAAGHHRNGVLLSGVTAELVVDCVAGKGLPADARAFDPARF